jgi:hypothetical protein
MNRRTSNKDETQTTAEPPAKTMNSNHSGSAFRIVRPMEQIEPAAADGEWSESGSNR